MMSHYILLSYEKHFECSRVTDTYIFVYTYITYVDEGHWYCYCYAIVVVANQLVVAAFAVGFCLIALGAPLHDT